MLNQIIDFCKDKSVVLVGNSSRLLMRNKNSKTIEDFDVVVRMNHGIPDDKTSPFVGRRCDIWICSFNSKPKQVEEYKRMSAKYTMRFNNNMVDPSLEGKMFIWDENDYNKFKEELGFLPTTGCLTTYFFNTYVKPKSINLIGFDFFQSQVFYSDKDFKKIAYAYHAPDKEKVWMESYIKKSRINHIVI